MAGRLAIWQRLGEDLRPSFQSARGLPKDIDFVAPRRSSKSIQEVFASARYVADERLIAWHGETRHRYFRLDDRGVPLLEVDVFLGEPPTCHDVGTTDPGACAGPALPATDLLLQKLQIVRFSDRDLADTAFVIGGHALVNGDALAPEDAIDVARIARRLAADWGFHHTATGNLRTVAAAAGRLRAPRAVPGRIQSLLDAIEGEPKGRKWSLRARVGTRKQWYRDVEDVER